MRISCVGIVFVVLIATTLIAECVAAALINRSTKMAYKWFPIAAKVATTTGAICLAIAIMLMCAPP
jgi:hypothetical protein